MEMKKVACVVLVAAASMSAALATTEAPQASPAAAPGPSSGATAASFPAVESLIGAAGSEVQQRLVLNKKLKTDTVFSY
ncbi:hypothetical protein L6164_019538 [Bauhinia variegata]|uniref:Uncharacterized protein n=1 Tax=Bauhinia variegata TaxID=167791 RepID=A0ACB9MU33_BAUVA|nr:hypothetical protein L6164_019538 [Bauhinia variegata]